MRNTLFIVYSRQQFNGDIVYADCNWSMFRVGCVGLAADRPSC